MKTPEEIKKGLDRCKNGAHCDNCISAYHCQVEADALAYIQQLEVQNAELTEKAARYLDLVKMTFKHIYPRINTERITEIDDGSYQGTLLYVMPLENCQPFASDYLLTCIEYGSCSVCDALQSIKHEDTGEEQKKDLLTLCRDMVVETVKPYNYGWRIDKDFDIVDDFNDNMED